MSDKINLSNPATLDEANAVIGMKEFFLQAIAAVVLFKEGVSLNNPDLMDTALTRLDVALEAMRKTEAFVRITKKHEEEDNV